MMMTMEQEYSYPFKSIYVNSIYGSVFEFIKPCMLVLVHTVHSSSTESRLGSNKMCAHTVVRHKTEGLMQEQKTIMKIARKLFGNVH